MSNDLVGRLFFIRTFGCQMNENDSEKIAGVLAAEGARPAGRAEDADILIINSCAVRAKSEEKMYSYLGRLAQMKARRPLLIGVAGCIAQIEGDRILSRRLGVDFVIGPDEYLKLPEILARTDAGPVVAAEQVAAWQEAPPRLLARQSPISAFVTIMEGCDNFCSYCIVPMARGREKFRPLESIRAEVEDLARRGYREIQFLGQNVNSYRDPDGRADFARLLAEMERIPGPEWIRFLTSHPRSFGPSIIEAMAASPRICRQLHLPIQSGSSSVLARMNRGYSRADYLGLVARLRERLPGLCLSTDIIVGFPGETEEEFLETLAILEEIRFTSIFSFRYSPRPGTAAARGPDDVPLEVKRRRLIEVQTLQKRLQTEFHRSLIGRTLKVLALGPGKKDATAFSGRTEGGQVVNFRAEGDVTGRFLDLEIIGAGPYSLRGAPASLPS
ncbi:MAG: tRNA (N6-isopentenyl adenosine(37)-C2)-methylthiotransferase MiaB [Candidatus Aminicenantes bacterium]|nr:tRNA (N6-isopentenyl adenosine(37)-C2)-methylthiotransferase MiaB [Candidatus Aminicenantes bacterium]